MKVACDFCEKVISTDDRRIKSDWISMKLGTLEYLLCEKCSDNLFHYIDKASESENHENNTRSM